MYYVVCNMNGPISVELVETENEAIATFDSLNKREAIDTARTDMEDALDINGTDMTEDEFTAAAQSVGAREVCDLDPVINAHAGTMAHLVDGWTLWKVAH